MRAVFASLTVLLAGVSVLWQATDGLGALTTESARRLAAVRAPIAIPAVMLEDMAGTIRPLRSEVTKRITVVEFIYTSCPTICRAAGDALAQLRDRMITKGMASDVRILSVSFDPAIDGPAELAAYGDIHGADGTIWTVARPRVDDLDQLLKTFGVQVIADDYGGFEHNAAIHVVDPLGRLVSIVDIDDIDGAIAAVAALL